MRLEIEIGFFSHIFPQLISMGLIIIYFFHFLRHFNGKQSYSNLGTALISLLFGKFALFLCFRDPLVVKLLTASSLTFYFIFMVNELTACAHLSSKYIVIINTLLLVILSVNYDPSVSSQWESGSFMVANSLLFAIGYRSKCAGITQMRTSFLLFAVLHGMTAFHPMSQVFASIFYAWSELPLQFIFLLGLQLRIKELCTQTKKVI